MKYLILIIAILGGSVCAEPVQLKEKLQSQERIGYLVVVDDSPVHTHMGATSVLPDEDDPYPYNWKLNQHIQEQFNKRIRESSQFRILSLAEYGITASDLSSGLIIPEKAQTRSKQKVLQRLRNELQIRTVVTFKKSGKQSLRGNCSSNMFGSIFVHCTKIPRIKTGLLTTGAKISRSGYAVADVTADVYILDEQINLADSDQIANANKSMTNEFLSFTEPKSIKVISEEEWAPVRMKVEESIDHLVDAVVNELVQNRK